MTTLKLTDRADLFGLPAFQHLPADTSGQPNVLSNGYECDEDGNSWGDQWSCACDDECSECGASISPTSSEWAGPEDKLSRALWEALPEAGLGKTDIRVEVDGDDVRLAEGWLLIGKESPSIRRAGPWPAWDALARERIPDLPLDAIVYAASAGGEKSKSCAMQVAVVTDGKIVPGTKRSLSVLKEELREFCEAWEVENPIHAPETAAPSPSM